MTRASETEQLAALAEVGGALDAAGIDYWLFGGWAVDFYAGEVTRPHGDVDLAVWLDDAPRIAEVLRALGWRHAPEPDEDGGTGYERDGVRLELTYLVREGGDVFTPQRGRLAAWPAGAFGAGAQELGGVRARLIALPALAAGKAASRGDAAESAKNRADAAVLARLRPSAGPDAGEM